MRGGVHAVSKLHVWWCTSSLTTPNAAGTNFFVAWPAGGRLGAFFFNHPFFSFFNDKKTYFNVFWSRKRQFPTANPNPVTDL